MKAGLTGKAQTAAAIPTRNGGVGLPSHAAKADAAAGLDLLFQKLRRIALAQKQITVTTAEIAIDGFCTNDLLDTVDRSGQAVVQQLCFRFTAAPDEFVIKIVKSTGQMRRGAGGHAAGNGAAIQHGDPPAP